MPRFVPRATTAEMVSGSDCTQVLRTPHFQSRQPRSDICVAMSVPEFPWRRLAEWLQVVLIVLSLSRT
jgi:hypothetical protein